MADQLIKYAAPGEERTARKLVQYILDHGGTITIHDGCAWVLPPPAATVETILPLLASTGEDSIHWNDKDGKTVAVFLLLWWNAPDGSELIADYSANPLADAAWRAVSGEEDEQDEE